MSNSKSEMKADDFSGREVFATVIKVLPFGAFLRLPDVIEHGYLDISQVSDRRIEPPLTNTLKAGDRVEVLVKWFDEKNKTWETSHKAIIQRQRWESRGLTPPGSRFRAKVLKASELGAIVDIEGIRGSIFGGTDVWNAYNVLYQAGYLMPDESVEIVLQGWEAAHGRPKLRLYLGEPLKISRGAVCDGKVIFIRKNVVTNIHNMHDDLYAKLVGGEIARVMSTDFMAPEKTFPLGSTIPLVIGRYASFLGMFEAKIDWDQTNLPAPYQPDPGTVVNAKVTSVRPFGAICLISDRLTGLLHHSTIVQEKSGDTRRHLHPGDLVRAIVEPRPDDDQRKVRLRFLQLVDRTLDTEITESSDLIDLRASRRSGVPSGFQRDQDFRWNVLEAFDHTCCVLLWHIKLSTSENPARRLRGITGTKFMYQTQR